MGFTFGDDNEVIAVSILHELVSLFFSFLSETHSIMMVHFIYSKREDPCICVTLLILCIHQISIIILSYYFTWTDEGHFRKLLVRIK